MHPRSNLLSFGLLSAAACATMISYGCGTGNKSTPTPTPTPAATPTPKPGDPTPTSSPTPTPVPTSSPTPTPTPTPVSTPTPTPTPRAEFVVTDLGVTSGETYSIATDINNNGEIVGYSYSGALEPDGGSGIAWRSLNGSVPQEFADPGTIPLSINDNGNISGRIREGNKSVPAYHTSYSGFYDSLKILNGSTPSVRAGYAWCINSRGEIVGVNESQQDGLYWENYESTPIPESQITTHTQSIARAINSSGWIVGSGENAGGSRKALLWKPSGSGWSEQTISSSNALACSINQLGEAVGYSNSSAFYFNGTRTDLPRLGFGSAANHNDEPGQVDYDIRADAALDINDNGWIVGDSMVNSSSWRACIWRKDAGGTYRVTDLNSLIPAGSGWTLHSAKAINNRGQIVGYGSYAGSTRRAFLLTPTR